MGWRQVRGGRSAGFAYTTGRVEARRSGWAFDVICITLDRETVCCTEGHLFGVAGRGWVRAGVLKAGDRLLTISGEPLTIRKVERCRLLRPMRVYDIDVSGRNIFYVGKSGVLVYNKSI